MKLVTAILSPGGLDELRSRFGRLGVSGMTVSEAHGVDRGSGHADPVRGADGEVEFVPRLRVELLVDDEDAGRVTEVLARWATTGHAGGDLWVTHVETAAVRRSAAGSGSAAA
jgi:nitrogen regulatory protein P-II 1